MSGFPAEASGGHATKDGKSWPRQGWGWGQYLKTAQNSHDSAAFQCDQKGIQESPSFFWAKKWWVWCDTMVTMKIPGSPSLIWAIELRRKQICGTTGVMMLGLDVGMQICLASIALTPFSAATGSLSCPKNATKIAQWCSVASMLYLMWQLIDVNCTSAMWEYLALQSRIRLAAVLAKK